MFSFIARSTIEVLDGLLTRISPLPTPAGTSVPLSKAQSLWDSDL
jgi:hypothetical protein